VRNGAEEFPAVVDGELGLLARGKSSIFLSHRSKLLFQSVGVWAALQDMGVMQQTIEQRGDRGVVTQQLAPIVDRAVRSGAPRPVRGAA
jgi:hypothetical protein